MPKLILLSYYGLREALRAAADELEILGYEVINYSLLDPVEPLEEYISKHKPSILLFWAHKIEIPILAKIRYLYPSLYIIFFNWDDPFSWSLPEINIAKKSEYFDLALTSCIESTKWYVQNGTGKSKLSLPGFNPSIHHPIVDQEYICDISVCITNLYEDEKIYPYQSINRKSLVDLLAATPKIKFNIYGPEFLKERYPNNYKCFVAYSDLSRVFTNSRINLCTHVDNRYMYSNERAMLITGSKGLLLVDPIPDYDRIFSKEECVTLDIKDPIKQINNILLNYSEYSKISEKGYQRALSDYTWRNWAHHLHQEIPS